MKHGNSYSLQLFADAAPAAAAAPAETSPGAADPSPAPAGPVPADPAAADAAFDRLIKGDYADAFSRRVQKIIDDRFKKSKADAVALETLTGALRAVYPDFGGRTAAEMAALLPERTGGKTAAPRQPDETDRLLDAAEAQLLAGRRHAAAQKVIAGWEAQAEAVKARYPAFDLRTALREPGDFGRLLKAGLPLQTAYEAAHLDEILGEAMRYAAERAGARAAAALLEQRQRPQENPVCGRAATRTETDVNSLTGNDVLRILGEVSRGARITFR